MDKVFLNVPIERFVWMMCVFFKVDDTEDVKALIKSIEQKPVKSSGINRDYFFAFKTPEDKNGWGCQCKGLYLLWTPDNKVWTFRSDEPVDKNWDLFLALILQNESNEVIPDWIRKVINCKYIYLQRCVLTESGLTQPNNNRFSKSVGFEI